LPPSPPDNPLEFTDTDDLLCELARRNDASLFVSTRNIRSPGNGLPGREEYFMDFHGSPTEAIGLAVRSAFRLLWRSLPTGVGPGDETNAPPPGPGEEE
jgi:hypothetical protein